MEVTPGLHAAMRIPGNRVHNSWLDRNYTNRANPTLTLFSIGTAGLLESKFHAALYNGVWQGHFEHGEVKFAILGLRDSPAPFTAHG
jgi:hypothetical protein